MTAPASFAYGCVHTPSPAGGRVGAGDRRPQRAGCRPSRPPTAAEDGRPRRLPLPRWLRPPRASIPGVERSLVRWSVQVSTGPWRAPGPSRSSPARRTAACTPMTRPSPRQVDHPLGAEQARGQRLAQRPEVVDQAEVDAHADLVLRRGRPRRAARPPPRLRRAPPASRRASRRRRPRRTGSPPPRAASVVARSSADGRGRRRPRPGRRRPDRRAPCSRCAGRRSRPPGRGRRGTARSHRPRHRAPARRAPSRPWPAARSPPGCRPGRGRPRRTPVAHRTGRRSPGGRSR